MPIDEVTQLQQLLVLCMILLILVHESLLPILHLHLGVILLQLSVTATCHVRKELVDW